MSCTWSSVAIYGLLLLAATSLQWLLLRNDSKNKQERNKPMNKKRRTKNLEELSFRSE
jgi:hypothetical protein